MHAEGAGECFLDTYLFLGAMLMLLIFFSSAQFFFLPSFLFLSSYPAQSRYFLLNSDN